MGCEQSTPVHGESMQIGKQVGGKDASKKRISGIGQTERLVSSQLKRQQQNQGMQASNTATVSLDVDEEITMRAPNLNPDGTMKAEEVVRRTSSSLETSSISLGNKEKGGKVVHVQYAHRGQRGYYPDDPHKANQDELGITLNFAGEQGDSLFSVYDGHGSEGHHCARYAKKKLPIVLAKYLRQTRSQRYLAQLKATGKPLKAAWDPAQWPLLSVEDYEQCCRKALLETNQAMHDDKNVEDKLSGTTAATVCFHGGRLTVCNLGDSRVVIGHQIPDKKQAEAEETKEEEKCEIDTHGVPQDVTKSSAIPGSIMAIPLTKDQTPYRKDERERVRKEGAEIKSIDQMEGREDIHDNWGDEVLGDRADIKGDPPRVWIKGQEYPGTAFTRSLGDSIAETIGVTADPEILSVDLTVNDKYLVIASDGIFEFLTNQDVIDMCSASTNPLEACEMLTKAAYDQWLKYERRTDDISVIVCFLESDYQPSKEDEKGTTEELTEIPQTVYGTKPLRSNTKPASVEASIFEPGEDKNGESKADA